MHWNCRSYVVDNGRLICLNCSSNCSHRLAWSSSTLGYLFAVATIYECVDLLEILSTEDEDSRISPDMVLRMWFLKYRRFDLAINQDFNPSLLSAFICLCSLTSVSW